MTWVFCAGMLRSASTLQYQLAASIVEHANVGRRIRYAPEAEFGSVRQQHLGERAKLLVFKAHVCTDELLRECNDEGALVIYSFRDIRDVAVSAMRKFGKSFDQLREAGWLDQAVDDYYRWRSTPCVMSSRYEDMFDNVVSEARRINVHLGSHIGEEDVAAFAAGFTLEAQRRRVDRIKHSLGRQLADEEIVFDPLELLHHNHINDGEIGAWRRLLTPGQIVFLNDRYRQWTSEVGYESA